jgi:PAS domain S-box-containing protein
MDSLTGKEDYEEHLLNSQMIFVIKTDDKGNYTFANDAFKRKFVPDGRDILGTSSFDSIIPEDHKLCMDTVEKAIANPGIHQNVILRKPIKDGGFHVNQWDFIALTDSSGSFKEILCIGFSVSEKLKLEAQFYRSAQMLENILTQFPGVVFWKDPHGYYLGCNQSFALSAGFSKTSDIVGKSDFDMPWAEREGNSYRADDQLVVSSGKPLMNIIETMHKDNGEVLWFNTSKIPLHDENGKIIGVLGVAVDITSLKKSQEVLLESEQKFRFLAENTSDAILILEDHAITYASPSYERITGDKPETVIGMREKEIKKMIHPDDVETVFTTLYQAMEKQLSHFTYKYRAKHAGGHYYWREDSAHFFYNKKGEYQKSIVVVRDISERIRAQELESEVKIARETIEFKQKFLASMSHEIRTPLTGVLGMAEILSKTPLNETQSDYLETLILSGESLREIINVVLDYSKIEAGGLVLKPEKFRFSSLVKNAENLFYSICKKDIGFGSLIDPEIPLFLLADASKINQIITNYLSNAVKFTRKGSIDIDAIFNGHKTIKDERGKEIQMVEIMIMVKDSGIGIEEDQQKHLFTPFYQADNQGKRIFEGTGLGLSICKELAALMGGSVGVNSKPGEGSTFWFTFLGEEIMELTADDKPQKTVFPISGKRKNLNILVAEDKKLNQKVINIMLKGMGHNVSFYCNGKSAFEAFKPGLFDLIIMDIEMPVMDGVTATQKLKTTYKDQTPPIVGLSANALEGDREKYLALGLDEYLSKPLKIQDIKGLIDKIFG